MANYGAFRYGEELYGAGAAAAAVTFARVTLTDSVLTVLVLDEYHGGVLMPKSGNEYDVGDVIQAQATFTNSAGTAVDPTGVTFKVEAPDGTQTTYIYGTDAQVVKSSTGVYYVAITASLEGRYTFRFNGTGTNIAGGERHFFVRETIFN